MVGWRAGYSNTTGGSNTFLGNYAANSNLTGGQNVAIGNQAAYGGTKANKYVAVGYDALYYFGASKVDEESVGIGYLAGKYATGSYNTFVGSQAGKGGTTSAPYSSGQYSTAVGYQALQGFTTANYNTAYGYRSLYNNTTGQYNTALGVNAGFSKTATNYDVIIGQNAGYNLNGGDGANTIMGVDAAYYQNIAASNVIIGQQAMYGSATTDNAYKNVAIGNHALQQNVTGDNNVALGWKAGYKNVGNYNVYLGSMVSASAAGVDHEIVIGAGTSVSTWLEGGGTETVRIGNTTDFITNDFGENATWTHSSDRRVKKNIKDTNLGLEFILKLQPKEFQKKAPSEYPPEFSGYNPDVTERKNPDKIHYGFVAQEVKEAMDSVGHSEFPVWKENRDGMQELGEAELITPLVKAVQELTEIVKSQQKEIEELKNK